MEDKMKYSLLGLSITLLANLALGGCAAQSGPAESVELGNLGMSLRTFGSDGSTFRLRNAEFEVTSENYYWDYYGTSVDGGAGPATQVASSEDDLNASSINLSLEQGYYYVNLRPGWHMEKVAADGTATTVDAQLLNGNFQYLYVYPHGTSWVGYNFGIGSRSLWFNGEAQISITVYENPDDYYGYPSVDGGVTAPVPVEPPPVFQDAGVN
jgi:hypothetical protein